MPVQVLSSSYVRYGYQTWSFQGDTISGPYLVPFWLEAEIEPCLVDSDGMLQMGFLLVKVLHTACGIHYTHSNWSGVDSKEPIFD